MFVRRDIALSEALLSAPDECAEAYIPVSFGVSAPEDL